MVRRPLSAREALLSCAKIATEVFGCCCCCCLLLLLLHDVHVESRKATTPLAGGARGRGVGETSFPPTPASTHPQGSGLTASDGCCRCPLLLLLLLLLVVAVVVAVGGGRLAMMMMIMYRPLVPLS